MRQPAGYGYFGSKSNVSASILLIFKHSIGINRWLCALTTHSSTRVQGSASNSRTRVAVSVDDVVDCHNCGVNKSVVPLLIG